MFTTRRRRWIAGAAAMLALVALITTGFTVTAKGSTYQPQTRDFTVVAVPTLVHEMQGTLDYLQKDFAPGGLLDGKEVYAFSPSTLVVYQGDSVNLTLVNPADDAHTFTISDLNVNAQMPGQSSSHASFVAGKAGIYTFVCAEDEHSPYMWGQLIVLPDSQAPKS
ncbi:MAG TPA: cupredoxin domain-containing protein [Nitrolancea sp.]|nr:cupredoxin domain-containing protein [Nitrolancea sp.]